MNKISLSKGLVVLVDNKYYNILIGYSWCYQKGKDNNTYYAQANLPRKNGKRSKLKMHRLIMQLAGFDIKNKKNRP